VHVLRLTSSSSPVEVDIVPETLPALKAATATNGRAELLKLGVPKKRIAELLGVSRTTLYRYLKKLEGEKQPQERYSMEKPCWIEILQPRLEPLDILIK